MRSRDSAVLAAGLSLAALPAFAAYPAHPPTSPEINAADLSSRVKALADDAFEGRGPGTKNGEAAAQWIADELKRIGVKPGNNGSYFQTVPSVTIALDASRSHAAFATPQGALAPKSPDEIVYWTPRCESQNISLANSPLVFAGYGVVAPEYDWNDYSGIDVKGKTVLILVNDPGNEDPNPDPAFFKGKAMTYYGRWTYKFEEAARQGAAAAFIVHETTPAAYGYQVVRNSNSGDKSWLEAQDQNRSMVSIQGWLPIETARDLFKRAGLNYDEQKAAANKRGFQARMMNGETLSVLTHSKIKHIKTRNVVGVIAGRENPGDIFLYSAHWDHIGVKPDVAGPDKIYNGAVDNGMGVASILELAEKFASGPAPRRSLGFMFWTLEEQGLLGSQYFAEHPLWPRGHIVGVVNLDANLPMGRAHDMNLPGSGQSELEDYLSAALKTQGRVVTPDPEPQRGAFFRSDHFSLAKFGIPAISPDSGYDLLDGGKEAGKAVADDYRLHHYHQPSDEWSASWDLTGPVEDLEALDLMGDKLANGDAWPGWYAGSEFKIVRDKTMAGRAK